MPHRRRSFVPGFRLLLLVTLSCVSLLSSCSPFQKSIHPDFVQNFIDVNRRGDDDAATAVFDPVLRILAVGRESGRVELWDVTKTNSRIVLQAHEIRTEYIAFGREDGIVLTSSPFDGSVLGPEKGTRIWNARTGELVHVLKGMVAPGPVAASPVRNFYLIGDAGELLLYDHARRSLVGGRLKMEQDAQVTAMASDRKSGLIAIGTSRGELLLMTLNTTGEAPRLDVLRRISTAPEQARRFDIRALALLDDGKRLVSAAAVENGVFEWDTTTLKLQRQIPTTLNTVNWASSMAGTSWLVLGGTESTRGKIELVDLNTGIAWRYKANTTHPKAVLLPEIRLGLILQSGGATQIRYLDQK